MFKISGLFKKWQQTNNRAVRTRMKGAGDRARPTEQAENIWEAGEQGKQRHSNQGAQGLKEGVFNSI